jgi:photosystem II stability/assembly factor-like uncharacterized protein
MFSRFYRFFIPASIILINVQLLFSQPSWMYTEQTSGVTTSLNSVCVSGNSWGFQAWTCGSSGVVLVTTNAGNNWQSVGANGIPSNAELITIDARRADTVLTAGRIGTTTFVYRTVNGGANWLQVFSQPNGQINSIWMTSALTGFMTGNPVGGRWSLWKTTNGGLNWDSTGLYIPQSGSETGFPNSFAVMHNQMWFGTNNSRLYRSLNSGINWSSVTAPEVNSSAVWIYLDTFMFSYMLTGGNRIFSTTSNGANWTQLNGPDSSIPVRGFCPFYFGVFDSEPHGSYVVRNNNKVYAYLGVYSAEYTAPAGNYNHMAYDGNQFYWQYTFAVRSNGGITRISLFRGGGIKRLDGEIPIAYKLSQNYPNPFNPSTVIRFSIPPSGKSRAVETQIKVFDILGKEIAVPVNEQLSPGTYEVTFDAAKLTSGIYFYRITAGEYIETKRMVLVK